MSVVQLPTLAQIEEEAAVWVWRFDAGHLTASDRKEFDTWLRRDPRHKHAFDELGGVWDALDELAEAKRDEKIATFTTPPVAYPASYRARSRRFAVFAAAASVMVAIAAWWWMGDGSEAQMLSTAVGQQRSVTLADGSTVNLNTNTIVETSFVSDRREIRLLKGEAHFTVAPDAARPFRVHAGNTVVQAVGTAFNVRVRDPGDVEVLVTQGRVKVTAQKSSDDLASSAPRAPAVERSLQAGQRLETADVSLAVAAVSTEALANALAWRDGAIVFDGMPLSRAIMELNRYAETRFVITDPHVGEMRVGGRFRTGDIEEFLRGLETALPVVTRRTPDGLVFIESQPRPAAARSGAVAEILP